MLREQIDRTYAAAAGNGIAMICVDSAVVLLAVVPRDIANKAITALTRSAGSRPSAMLWAHDSSALSHIFLHFLIPNRLSTVPTVADTSCSSSGTSAMHWAVDVLTMLTAVASKTLTLVDLVRFVVVVTVAYESHTSPLAGLASTTWLGATVGTGVPTGACTGAIERARPVVVVAVSVCRACGFTITERAGITIRALTRSRDQIT
jgi:hypothetical protein